MAPQKPQLEFRDYLAVVQHMKLEAISLVIIYWVTLAIFPGIVIGASIYFSRDRLFSVYPLTGA
jgi:hypothetical protein